jgi:1-acyl-sn-glycerol-3-phosphate acyltransferase
MIVALRLVLLICLMLGFLLGAHSFTIDAATARHRHAIVRASLACRRALRILGIRTRVSGAVDDDARLQVANHLSYIDALILSATRPALFITSVEVQADPLLGRLARAAGCDFVERRHVGTLRQECERIALHLQHLPVLVFPEGTSSDGSAVLPFRPAFFASALARRSAVQPLCIRYPRIDGRPFGPTTHPRVCWYGDMAFLPHLLQLLLVRRIEAEVRYLEPLAVALDCNRKHLAGAAHRAISDALAVA